MEKSSRDRLVYSVKIAVLGSIAAILMLLEFPLPFAPGFYELDLSETAVLIGGFSLGPLAGVLVELIKVLLNLVMDGTDTAFVGEAANFIIGISLVLPAALIYKHKKTFRGAVLGMAVGTVCLAAVGSLLNYFVIIPAYVTISGIPLDTVISMGTAVNSGITDLKTLVLFAVVPFNLLKGIVCTAVTTLLYKRASPVLHRKF